MRISESVELAYNLKVRTGIWVVSSDGEIYRTDTSAPVRGTYIPAFLNGQIVQVHRRRLLLRHFYGENYLDRQDEWELPSGEEAYIGRGLSPSETETVLVMLRDYNRVADICEAVNVSPKAVYSVARRNGIKTSGHARKISETDRFRIVQYLLDGKSDTDIASLLSVSVSSVRRHTVRLRRSLGTAKLELGGACSERFVD